MLNKCAKFHGDSPRGQKVKFNLARSIELSETGALVGPNWCALSETADFGYNLKPGTSERLRWHIWPTFPLNFFMQFSHNMPSTFSIPWCKKTRMTRNSIQGSPPLIFPIIALRSGASACLGKASVTQSENQWPRFVSTQCDVVCFCCSEHPSSSTLWIVRRAPLTTMALLGKKTSFLYPWWRSLQTRTPHPKEWLRPAPKAGFVLRPRTISDGFVHHRRTKPRPRTTPCTPCLPFRSSGNQLCGTLFQIHTRNTGAGCACARAVLACRKDRHVGCHLLPFFRVLSNSDHFAFGRCNLRFAMAAWTDRCFVFRVRFPFWVKNMEELQA